MKRATAIIIEKIPVLEKHIKAHENMLMRQHVLNELDSIIERLFVELIWFFEDPKNNHFELKSLYDHLEGDWLSFAIEMIEFYFKEDTYLIPHSTESVIVYDDYLDQNGASRYLAKKGLSNFPQSKIATYIYRETFPKEDLIIAGKKFWKIETIDNYAKQQINNSKPEQ